MKKIIATILSFALLLSTIIVPGMIVMAEEADTPYIWSGETATSFADSSEGTEDDPILVATPEELALAVTSGNTGKFYKLTADMFLNNVSASDWTSNAQSWVSAIDFSGTIDGNGHIIYGLYANTAKAGLISDVSQSITNITFKNLGICNANLTGSDKASAFIAHNKGQNVTFEQCFVDETVSITASSHAGSFIGLTERGSGVNNVVTVNNCYTKATVGSGQWANAFFGRCGNSTFNVTNSYGLGKVYFANGGGNTSLYSGEDKFANLYVTDAGSGWYAAGTAVSAALMVGKLAKTNMPGLDYDNIWLAAVGTTPVLRQFADKLGALEDGPKPVEDANGIWTGEVAENFASGTGEENDPYLIQNAGELALAVSTGGAGKFYKLTKDIYLNDVSASNWYENEDNNAWYADINFKGTINGNGNIIYGLWYPTTQTGAVGLIPSMDKNGYITIENLGIRKARVYTTNGNAGGFIGFSNAQYGINIEQCFIDETANIHGTNKAGGFVGELSRSGSIVELNINNCYTKAVVDDVNDNSCGFLGQGYNATFTIKNSYCYGERIYHSNGSNRNTLSSDPAPFENLYTTIKGLSWAAGVGTVVADTAIIGRLAKANMPGLDYDNVWLAAVDTTPVLRQFAGKLGAVEDLPKPVEDENGIWTGVIADSFADKSEGTTEDPILIQNAGELALVVSIGGAGKTYKLTKDIYLNDVSADNWADNADNNAWFADGNFNGTIDGNNCIVYGLWYPEDQTGNVGLVPQVTVYQDTVTIKNLGIRYARIITTGKAAAFVGNVSNKLVTISYCFVDETVSIYGDSAAGFVGATARSGDINEVNISYCANSANISGSGKWVHGFLGSTYYTTFTVRNSYTYGKCIYGADGANRQSQSTADDAEDFFACYASVAGTSWGSAGGTVVAPENMIGRLAKYNMPDLDFENVWFAAKDQTPVLQSFATKLGAVEDLAPAVEENGIWTGEISDVFAEGSGTEDDPYLIQNAGELALMVSSGGEGKFYKLTKDIYLNDVSAPNWADNADNNAWFADVVFKGNIDGNGNIIYGIWYPEDQTGDVGLIPNLDLNGHITITKLGIRYSRIYSVDGNAGGFIGASEAQYTVAITYCFVDETVSVYGGDKGAGFVGAVSRKGNFAYLDINNCYTKAVVEDVNDNSCGFLGQGYNATFTIKNSYCYGERIYHSTAANRNTLSTEETPFDNLYTTNKGLEWAKNVGTVVSADNMTGSAALINMSGLDFENVWLASAGQTPVLRIFKDKLNIVDANTVLYTVTFKNEDGSVISTNQYFLGEALVVPETPTKENTNELTYVFAGWGNPTNCEGNAEYTATFTSEFVEYTVVFKDEDGTVLSEKTYHYGDTVVAPDAPTKAADNTYTYEFAGWNSDVVAVAGNAEYTATYTETFIEYTVVFKDEDGTVISTNTYHYGDAVVEPTAPTKAADKTYTYAFAGWNTAVVAVVGNAEYTAIYTETFIEYTVVFKDWDGTVLSTDTYHYGDTVVVPDAPERTSDDPTKIYAFTGWTPEVVVVDGNAEYTATFELRDPYVPGDIDGEAGVSDADARYLLMYTFFPEDYPVNQPVDFNGDKSVDDNDARYLLMHTFFPEDYPLN